MWYLRSVATGWLKTGFGLSNEEILLSPSGIFMDGFFMLGDPTLGGLPRALPKKSWWSDRRKEERY
jgi:hypothetical protein